eukprot:scaffold313_cov140-Skeletonema_dohrnii-CCMP3373.AAC.2
MPHLVPRPTILQTAESILRIQRSKWIYHERALAKSLGLSIDILRGFVQSIGREIGSGGGPLPCILQQLTSTAATLNILNLHRRMQHGSSSTNQCDGNPEEPSLAHAVTGLIGRKEIRDKRITMIRMVTGTHEALDICGAEYKTNRQQI